EHSALYYGLFLYILGSTWWCRHFIFSLLYPYFITGNIFIIEFLDGDFSLTDFWHFNKSKTFGFTGGFIEYQITGLNPTKVGKNCLQFLFRGGASEITN